MKLIAESGSTKTKWIVLDNNTKVIELQSSGFNPLIHSTDYIANTLKNSDLKPYFNTIKTITFYGAGCSSKERNQLVFNALKRVFPAAKISIDHDLMAAIKATTFPNKGLVCILGTGSNSCYFNGKTTESLTPSLGYILGDEGSGAYLGKLLIVQYLNNELPIHIATAFKQKYNLNKDEILSKVYGDSKPNKWLASFAPFLHLHKSDLYIQKLLVDAFKLFLKRHILPYNLPKTTPLFFVGSIAHFFRDELKIACKNYGHSISGIVQNPIEKL